MVIDFGFGGSSFLRHNVDLVEELGHHDYVFTFTFDGMDYLFRRGTVDPEAVYRIDNEAESESLLSLEEYTAFLKAAYRVDLEDISFRALVSPYIRVWGRENLDVRKPLHATPKQRSKESVENLIKAFNLYREIREAAESLGVTQERLGALKGAVKSGILAKVGKRGYRDNEVRIEGLEAELNDIKANLAKYAASISDVVNREVLALKMQRDELRGLRLRLEGKLIRIQKNISGNRHIRSKNFESLREFFPSINEERLVKIEEFHSGLAKLLRAELRESEKRLQEQVASIDREVSSIDFQMSAALGSVEEPSALVDRVYKVATQLRDAKEENRHFDDERILHESVQRLKLELAEKKLQVLYVIETRLNSDIRGIVARVFGSDRKSPYIKFTENGYSYTVFEDTGTGTAYAGLIVFDIAVFQSTILPVVVHDSLLFKNIENDSVARLVQVYEDSSKQSFIALDEIVKYGTYSADLLRRRSVIQLDNEHVLYIKDWRRKSAPASNSPSIEA
jgi:hypothetical protein